MTAAMPLIQLKSIMNLAGFQLPHLKKELKKPYTGIWKTEPGGKISFPVNMRTIIKKCTGTARAYLLLTYGLSQRQTGIQSAFVGCLAHSHNLSYRAGSFLAALFLLFFSGLGMRHV